LSFLSVNFQVESQPTTTRPAWLMAEEPLAEVLGKQQKTLLKGTVPSFSGKET
jgi:hypothetical protein